MKTKCKILNFFRQPHGAFNMGFYDCPDCGGKWSLHADDNWFYTKVLRKPSKHGRNRVD